MGSFADNEPASEMVFRQPVPPKTMVSNLSIDGARQAAALAPLSRAENDGGNASRIYFVTFIQYILNDE